MAVRIVHHFDDAGLADNTLIIFTSDNDGNASVAYRFDTSGPLGGFERDLTEGGIRVPFIARRPGVVPAKQVSAEVIAFQDMMPTFAQLAGLRPPSGCDGVAIVGALEGGKLEGGKLEGGKLDQPRWQPKRRR